jgi:hypothetical protein
MSLTVGDRDKEIHDDEGKTFVLLSLALGIIGTASTALAQAPVQLKFTRVVDLTLPIESNMAGIPRIKTYADNPSRVTIVTAISEAQRSCCGPKASR